MLEDYRTAPIDERLRAMLGFLEKLTLQTPEIEASDIEALREAGLSDKAIEEAIYVSTMFNTMDRLADAFDFKPTPDDKHPLLAFMLGRVGYKAASVPG